MLARKRSGSSGMPAPRSSACRLDRPMIETAFVATSVKLCPGASTKRGVPRASSPRKPVEEGGDLGPARLGPGAGQQRRRVRRRGSPACRFAGRRRECSSASLRIGHQAAEMALLQPGGRGRDRRASRPAPRRSGGHAAGTRPRLADLLQRLGGQALHRVAVDVLDAHRNFPSRSLDPSQGGLPHPGRTWSWPSPIQG